MDHQPAVFSSPRVRTDIVGLAQVGNSPLSLPCKDCREATYRK